MAKKRFGISPSVNNALNQTIRLAEAEDSNLFSTEILVERIKLDPENPRKHKITLDDLEHGPSKRALNYTEKQAEYESLSELSASIVKDGLLHPIVVVKEGEDFKLVAGERRFLASLMAKKTTIEARVFKRNPSEFDLKVVQWMENQARKDLPLYNKLMNIEAIHSSYVKTHQSKMTAIKLSELISTSRQSAQFYLAILANQPLMEVIKSGKVTSLKRAIELVSYKSAEEILQALSKRVVKTSDANSKTTKTGRRLSINLGATKSTSVVKTIVDSVLKLEELTPHAEGFKHVDWTSKSESTKAFQQLVKLLESEVKI